MRDMNQELLDNPYDQELQSITGPFGTLLREIVATIDRHGLKHQYLGRHERDVAKYFESLATRTFRSEAAEALRERLVKYREKLFTFIRHDAVPWNNNNAENAIRQFAYYREDTTRMLTEVGLTDHLSRRGRQKADQLSSPLRPVNGARLDVPNRCTSWPKGGSLNQVRPS
jgi:hypothetical protein